jgi:arylsulfatase A-like enzyme
MVAIRPRSSRPRVIAARAPVPGSLGPGLPDARWLLGLLAAAALALLPGCAPDDPARALGSGTPVVLVVVDTLRADRLSHAGHERDTAAGLDAFLEDATFFERCWAPAPWTTPSTATILTGLHPLRHGATGHGRALPGQAVTLAEHLGDAGYHTAAFSHNQNASAVLGFDQGFDVFEAHKGKSTAYDDISLMVERTERWMDDERADPFFLWLQPMNVHGPYKVPEPHADDLLGREPARGFQYYGTTMRAILKEGDIARRERVSEVMLDSLGETYDTAIRYTLDQVGEVFDDLRERGLYDRALIVLTSDHGEELFEHGGFSHGYSLHRELLHVPLYVKLPGQRTGTRVGDHVTLADVAPTVLQVLGQPLEAGATDGRSLIPLMQASAKGRETAAVSDARGTVGAFDPFGGLAGGDTTAGAFDPFGGLANGDTTAGAFDPYGGLANGDTTAGAFDPYGGLAGGDTTAGAFDPFGGLASGDTTAGAFDPYGGLAGGDTTAGAFDPYGGLANGDTTAAAFDPYGGLASGDSASAAPDASSGIGGPARSPAASASEEPVDLLFHVDWWKRCMARALQRGRWKLVAIERNYEGLEHVVRLYDIEADPGETVDLSSEHPDVVAELTRRLDALTALHRSRALQAGDDVLSQMDRQTLEELGYL